VRVLYFAWLRERLNRSEEEVSPPAGVATVEDLIVWLGQRDEAAQLAMADRSLLRAAVNQQIVPLDASIVGASEVALFPPMTGG